MQEETQHRMNPFSATRGNNSIRKNGFALPVVITIGLFMIIAGFAMMARTFGSFRGSIKNNQQQQAQELAEEGVSKIIDQLNTNYRYLWVNCYDSTEGSCTQSNIGGWNNSDDDYTGEELPQINVASCLDVTTTPASNRNENNYSADLKIEGQVTPADTDGKQAKRGIWSLDSYTFEGDPWMGGRGILRVRGNRTTTSGSTAASALIEHHVEVKSKPCKKRLTENFDSTTFPGLLARAINLQNNDVVGYPSANVYCTSCDDITDINRGPNYVVDGDIFTGDVTLPSPPTFPQHLRDSVTPGDLVIANGSNDQIIIDPPDANNIPFNPLGYTPTGQKPMCVKDTNAVSHCLVGKIDVQGNKSFLVKTYPDGSGTGTRPVRLYLGGSLEATGQATIENTGNSTSLAIFGPQSCPTPNQTITVGGGATVKAFIYAPCATVGVNGGSTRALCQEPGQDAQNFDNRNENPDKTSCTGGDFEGAIWAKEWTGSASNNAEISVPQNIQDELISIFGEHFSIGPSDFVGVGVPRWTSYQSEQ